MAASLGFVGKHLICMQGPFSRELNTAMLRQFDAAYLVTKDSGKVGGFEEKLAVAFNDVDFCVKVRHAGYLVVYDPYAELYHHESKTRGYENTEAKKRRFQEEIEYMRCHWMPDILRDPYYNENLSLKASDYSLRS